MQVFWGISFTIRENLIFKECPPAHIPNTDRLSCKKCENHQISKKGRCEACPIPGYVPNVEQSGCSPCHLSQIAVKGKK